MQTIPGLFPLRHIIQCFLQCTEVFAAIGFIGHFTIFPDEQNVQPRECLIPLDRVASDRS